MWTIQVSKPPEYSISIYSIGFITFLCMMSGNRYRLTLTQLTLHTWRGTSGSLVLLEKGPVSNCDMFYQPLVFSDVGLWTNMDWYHGSVWREKEKQLETFCLSEFSSQLTFSQY